MSRARPSFAIVGIVEDSEQKNNGKANSEMRGNARRASVETHREEKGYGEPNNLS